MQAAKRTAAELLAMCAAALFTMRRIPSAPARAGGSRTSIRVDRECIEHLHCLLTARDGHVSAEPFAMQTSTGINGANRVR